RVGRRQALKKTSLYQLVFFVAVQLFIPEGQCIDDFNSSGPVKTVIRIGKRQACDLAVQVRILKGDMEPISCKISEVRE
ncbi:hypothetical protein, partial [Bacillus haynesii]|uniref:hypothetical protein n=2 Tax=Bacillus haynesii TaxID=1925021 RepID=UPI002DBBC137